MTGLNCRSPNGSTQIIGLASMTRKMIAPLSGNLESRCLPRWRLICGKMASLPIKLMRIVLEWLTAEKSGMHLVPTISTSCVRIKFQVGNILIPHVHSVYFNRATFYRPARKQVSFHTRINDRVGL